MELYKKYLMSEDKWSGGVQTKYSPPEGLFKQSAEAIADQLAKDSNSLKQAMSRLNFYINRAGDNLSGERKSELERAKGLLRKKFPAGSKEE